MTDYLKLAKDYIAIAESGDSKIAAYKKAAKEIQKARDEGWSWPAIGRELGRTDSYARRLIAWSTNLSARGQLPFGGEAENERKARVHAKAVLSNPEQRRAALSSMEATELAWLAQEAQSAAARKMEGEHAESKRNAKAIRQEHPRSTSKIQEMLIGTILDSARSRVIDAVRKLVDAEDELTEKALERLRDKNEELATAVEAVDELLTGRVDWDAALAELTEGR